MTNLSKRSRINLVALEEECEAGDICKNIFIFKGKEIMFNHYINKI